MNIRNVLKTYANLRQLTDDETALLNTLRSLNDSERELVVQSLQPEKATKKASKKQPSKSKRASGLGDAIKGNLERREPTVGGFADDDADIPCGEILPNGSGKCGHLADDVLHHDQSYGNYHKFVPASTEQSAVVSGD